MNYTEHICKKYTKPELVNVCKGLGLKQTGGKREIARRVSRQLHTGGNTLQEQIFDAAKTGNTAELLSLLNKNNNLINAVDRHGSTALSLAAEFGRVGAVEALLRVPGIAVNAANKWGGSTALTLAAARGYLGVVTALLQVPNIDVNAADISGYTALIWAAEMGYVYVVAALLGVPGIDVNAVDRHGHTALTHATQEIHHDIVNMINTYIQKCHDAVKKIRVFRSSVNEDLFLGDGTERTPGIGPTVLMKECGMTFNQAFKTAKKVYNLKV